MLWYVVDTESIVSLEQFSPSNRVHTLSSEENQSTLLKIQAPFRTFWKLKFRNYKIVH